ncbi:MAG: Fe-S cluster assembly protein SufD [Thermonemataceae bacterium]|nr:Fe-S cluster assembly protein SufD [Thermonemataceae bacterium]
MTDTDKSFKHIFSSVTSPNTAYVQKMRESAVESLTTLELPTNKHEEWKYTSLKKIQNADYQFYTKKEFDNLSASFLPKGAEDCYVLVVVNGILELSLSEIPQEISILSLQEANEKGFLDNYFSAITNDKNEFFTALNTAYANNGLYICIPKNVVLQKDLLICQISKGSEQALAFQQRNLLIAEANSQAKIGFLYLNPEEKEVFSNEVTEIFVAANASLSLNNIQNEGEKNTKISTIYAKQERQSKLAFTTISLSGHIVRNNLNICISGEYSESYMNGLSLLKSNTHVDHHTLADHQSPNSYSSELYKGVFDENSTGVFNGKIYVRQAAQKTNAYQQNRNILLSEQASIYTKPQLEIWADDVKCSHGATTGKLDESAIFYMRARGISETEAKKLLLRAFAQEIIDKLDMEVLKNYLEDLI